MTPARQPKPEQYDEDDPRIVPYRLKLLESAVKELTTKFDKQDTIKKADLLDFKDTLVGRISEIQGYLQKQIDQKADKGDLDNLVSQFRYASGIISTVIAGLVIFYFTRMS